MINEAWSPRVLLTVQITVLYRALRSPAIRSVTTSTFSKYWSIDWKVGKGWGGEPRQGGGKEGMARMRKKAGEEGSTGETASDGIWTLESKHWIGDHLAWPPLDRKVLSCWCVDPKTHKRSLDLFSERWQSTLFQNFFFFFCWCVVLHAKLATEMPSAHFTTACSNVLRFRQLGNGLMGWFHRAY